MLCLSSGRRMLRKIPLGPPLAKGEDGLFRGEIVALMPPFCKGGLGGFHSRIRLSTRRKTLISELPPMGAESIRVGSWTKAPGNAGGCFTASELYVGESLE